MRDDTTRRGFLKEVGAAAGAAALVPSALGACNRPAQTETTPPTGETNTGVDESQPVQETVDPLALPTTRPEGWDPIAFNRDRGNAGAIPESYREDINGPDGENAHLGKHLPYVPETDDGDVPEGFLALMWGDPELGHSRHPNSPRGTEGYERGHWYDWVRVRKAVDGDAEEVETTFTDWPEPGDGQTGRYAVQGDGAITDDTGRNTIYLVRLPAEVAPGDLLRVHAHCLYHGEYVDFLPVPGEVERG